MYVASANTLPSSLVCSLLALFLGACGSDPVPPASAEVPEYQGGVPGDNGPGALPAAGDDGSEPALPPTGQNEPSSNPEQGPTDIPRNPDVPPVSAPLGADPVETPPAVEPPAQQPPPPRAGTFGRPTRGTSNLFTDVLGKTPAEVDDKVRLAVNRVFGIGTNEPSTPTLNAGYRLYFELPQDRSMAFIWASDSNDIRSEGMSYGMMIAVQMDMQEEFNRLWKFARTYMQFAANSSLTSWRSYFRWQGAVDTANAANWAVNYAEETGPAPDGEEYLTAALYLADRRWGSDGGVNYLQEASAISAAMLNNPAADGRTPVIDREQNMVVFYPQGTSATFSDPSYHLPAFYEIFAADGPEGDSARWRQVSQTSRQYFVSSANADTGLHPDYANFNGTPNTGGSYHDQFQHDAWRVVMNMAVDYAWTGADSRLEAQVEKYHSFFTNQLRDGNVANATFAVNGSGAGGGGSTALTATLAAGALASDAPNKATYVENLWKVTQQTGQYRYYQETVYLLGLLSAAGRFGYEWSDAAP